MLNTPTKNQFQSALQNSKSAQKEYEQLQARLTLLKQNENKNLQMVKLYDLAIEKVENGRRLKKQLHQMKSEADLMAEEEMRRKREQIAQIKQSEMNFIQFQNRQRSVLSKARSQEMKQYRSTVKLSMVRTQTTIIGENTKKHDQFKQAELERKQKLQDLRTSKQQFGQQNYQNKVQRELDKVKNLKEKVSDMEKQEQLLLNRLKATQDLAARSQRKFLEADQKYT